MRRHCVFSLALLFAACAQSPAAPSFPSSLAGMWKLKGVRKFEPAAAPELVRRIGTRAWWSAAYEGPGEVTVEAYALFGPPGGLEMAQEWRPVADAVVWYTPRYFVIVRWKNAEPPAVKAIVRELENQLKNEP